MPEVEIGGARLFYRLEGDKAPLLLIPGLGMDHSYYNFGIPLLARHFAVYAVDPIGIGQSSKPAPPYSVEGWADDFAALRGRPKPTGVEAHG